MKALVFTGTGKIVYEDFPDPKLADARDMIIAVNACSICGSDLHIYHGDRIGPFDYSKPMEHFCVGHEAIGEVVEVGAAVRRHKLGDRVMVSPGVGCGECPACLRGQASLCHKPATAVAYGTSSRLQGSQAQYFRVRFADITATRIPEGISDEQALLLTDALSTAYFGAKGAQVSAGDVAVVIGLGPVGLMAVESCYAMGAERVYAIDPVAFRRDMATRVGAISLSPEQAVATVKQETQGLGADVVIEAVGLDATLKQAVKIARNGGRIFVLGIVQGGADLPLAHLQMKNLRLFSGTASVVDNWPELIALVQHGKIKGKGLFTHRYALAQGAEAYATFNARAENALKMMIEV